MATKLPNSFCTIDPTFTILDESKVEAEMKRMVEATKSEEGCMFYSFVRNGKKLICREAYVDGAAVNAHVANVGSLLGGCLENGILKMESLIVHGPADQLEIAKESTAALGARYAKIVEGGFTALTEAAGKDRKESPFCVISPTFTILKPDKLDAACAEMVERTTSEEKCIYYDFTKYGEDKLTCREAYADGDGVNAHVGNVGDLLGKALDDGIIKLESLNLQGPADQLEVAKATLDAFGCEYLAVTGEAFVRFSTS